MGRQNYAAPSSARHARRNTLKRIAISLVAWAFVITGSASAATLAAAEVGFAVARASKDVLPVVPARTPKPARS